MLGGDRLLEVTTEDMKDRGRRLFRWCFGGCANNGDELDDGEDKVGAGGSSSGGYVGRR